MLLYVLALVIFLSLLYFLPTFTLNSSDQLERECLEWKDAIDGGKYLPGVGIDGIVYEHYRGKPQIGRQWNSADTKYRDYRKLKKGWAF